MYSKNVGLVEKETNTKGVICENWERIRGKKEGEMIDCSFCSGGNRRVKDCKQGKKQTKWQCHVPSSLTFIPQKKRKGGREKTTLRNGYVAIDWQGNNQRVALSPNSKFSSKVQTL